MLKELRNKLNETVKAAKDIVAKAETENRSLTADERTNYDKALADAEVIKGDIERRSKLDAFDSVLSAPTSQRVAPGDVTGVIPAKDLRNYSYMRAIRSWANGQKLEGLEAEVSQEIALRSGKKPQGFYIPMGMEKRALDTSAGTGAVGVNLLPDMIELLRDKLVLQSLGATIMSDMEGKFSIPRQTGGATAYWVGESGAPTASSQTIGQVPFTPKTVGAFTDISRQFMNQSSVAAEGFVRNDLAAVLARAIDKAGIAGTGSSNQPTGIVNQSGISVVSHGTNGSAESWAKVVEYETKVLAANIDPNSKLSYLSNSKVAGSLKTIDKTVGNYGQFILTNDGKVNGYNFAVSNALASNGTKGTGTNLSTMIFGNFADLVIALWGGLDLTVDPYSGSTSGTLRIVALQDCDIQVRHPESFAVATDIIA